MPPGKNLNKKKGKKTPNKSVKFDQNVAETLRQPIKNAVNSTKKTDKTPPKNMEKNTVNNKNKTPDAKKPDATLSDNNSEPQSKQKNIRATANPKSSVAKNTMNNPMQNGQKSTPTKKNTSVTKNAMPNQNGQKSTPTKKNTSVTKNAMPNQNGQKSTPTKKNASVTKDAMTNQNGKKSTPTKKNRSATKNAVTNQNGKKSTPTNENNFQMKTIKSPQKSPQQEEQLNKKSFQKDSKHYSKNNSNMSDREKSSENVCSPQNAKSPIAEKRHANSNELNSIAPVIKKYKKENSSEDDASSWLSQETEEVATATGSDMSDFSGFSEEEDYTDTDDDDDDYSDDDDSSISYFDSELIDSEVTDEDYHLPEDVPEDLIIHQGTATTYPLTAKYNIHFEDSADTQIIELGETSVQSIVQPSACDRNEMIKLSEINYQPIYTPQLPSVAKVDASQPFAVNNDNCPKLVPLGPDPFDMDSKEEHTVDNDSESYLSGFTGLSSTDEENISSDDESLNSVDINSKYMHEIVSSTDDDDFNEAAVSGPPMTANIVYATNSTYTEDATPNATVNEMELNEGIDPLLPSYEDYYDSVEANCNHDEIRIVNAVVMDPKEPLTTPTDGELFADQQQMESAACEPTVAMPQMQKPKKLNIFCNAINSNMVIVVLKEPIYIYGTVRLTLLAGNVEIYGFTPTKNKELEIFSPRGSASVDIKPITTKSVAQSKDMLTEILKRYQRHFTIYDLENVAEKFVESRDALVLLQCNVQCRKRINFICKHMNENVFPKVSALNSIGNSAEYLLGCHINERSEKSLKIPTQWLQPLLTNKPTSKVMLVGGKSVGKSTLLRYTANRYLQKPTDRILLIDLDIGQPELFVPQTISCSVIMADKPLLGPGFFQNLQPVKAFMVGHTNVLLCMTDYLIAVRQLLDFCRNHRNYAKIPWLVNTMGYNKGFGLELIALLIEIVQPTDVVQIVSNREISNFDAILEPHVLVQIPRNITGDKSSMGADAIDVLEYKLHVFESVAMQESRYQREWDMSAKDLRYLMILSRLSDTLLGTSEWITDGKPFNASLRQIKVVNMCGTTMKIEELHLAVEIGLTYLCHDIDDSLPLECLGIGIVRALDHVTQQIFIMPAMPLDHMTLVNCIALGEMPLFTSLMINQGPKVVGTAPFVYDTLADGNATRSIQQMYYRPREFLSGKHRPVVE